MALTNDLYKINNLTFQWKVSFNPTPRKQSEEIIFDRKPKENVILRFVLIRAISKISYQKTLEYLLMFY